MISNQYKLDYTGVTLGYLTGIRPTDRRISGSLVWVWKCRCGQDVESRSTLVKLGKKKSCGCHLVDLKSIPPKCKLCQSVSNRRTKKGFYSTVCSKCSNKRSIKNRNPILAMISAAKVRAKEIGVPFSITRNDIVIPEFCPIFGIKLERGRVEDRYSSPSLDRISPKLGYVPGNVAIISYGANRIKNEGTAEQHRLIADWIDNVSNMQFPDGKKRDMMFIGDV